MKGGGCFHLYGGATKDWLSRTVRAHTVNSLTLKQWIEEFQRLKDVNGQILPTAKGGAKQTRNPGTY